MASFRWIFPVSAVALFGTMASLQIAPAQQQAAGAVLFVHAPDGGPPWPTQDIYSMDADGANLRALTTDGHSHNPTWSPDGRHVLFVHDSALQTPPPYKENKQFESYHPTELYVMDRDGSNRHLLRRLGPVIFSAALSPDGKTLAVSGLSDALSIRRQPGDDPIRAGLFLLPADAQGEPHLLFRNALTPAWSPDGKKLAFSVERPRGQWAVHVANSDGSNDVQLTEPPLIAGSPAWSPDGKLIAYDQFVGHNQQIFVMDADGSHQREITTGSSWSCMHPSWSADGKQLVFSCRSASTPCGVVSSVGTLLPECSRRLFLVSPFSANATPVQINERDGAAPEFAPL